mgnify:CR=1 FL=1
MRNDFMPVHLMNANAKLDKHVLADEARKRNNNVNKKDILQESLWKKFVGLFKR